MPHLWGGLFKRGGPLARDRLCPILLAGEGASLEPDIRSVHVKDANRPTTPGTWGEEVPLGHGQVNIRQFVKTLQKVGYRGALCIEREVGNPEQRLADVAHGIRYLRQCLAE